MDLRAARNEGREAGGLEVARSMLRALVVRRFGGVSRELEARIEHATIVELQRLQLESADAPALDVALRRAGWRD